MGTKSKGIIKTVEILTGKKDKDGNVLKNKKGNPLTRFIDVRLQSNKPVDNCPAEYDPSKMKVIKRSLRTKNIESKEE